MPCLVSPLERANGILRLHDLPLRIRVRRHSQWLSVYEILPGGGTRERAMRGYSAQSDVDVQRLCDSLVEQGRSDRPQLWMALAEPSAGSKRRPGKWCNSGGSAPATPGLTARLPHVCAVAMGGPVCDPVRSTTTKPNTDHDPHP